MEGGKSASRIRLRCSQGTLVLEQVDLGMHTIRNDRPRSMKTKPVIIMALAIVILTLGVSHLREKQNALECSLRYRHECAMRLETLHMLVENEKTFHGAIPSNLIFVVEMFTQS